MRAVTVTVNHGIHHGFPHGHADLQQLVFIETSLFGQSHSDFFGAIHAFEGGIEKPLYRFSLVPRWISHKVEAASQAWPSRRVRINYRCGESQERHTGERRARDCGWWV